MGVPARERGSFRDPSGFMFQRDGIWYRQVNPSYQADYDRLMASGLYQELVTGGLLIPHQEVAPELAYTAEAYKVLQPEALQFISYPYEWSFGQLKAAALATLAAQKIAFEHGMTLKDASAYNIQFVDGRPVLIDTLSFEQYREGSVWTAYRQFCQHFLAPLALMAYTDARLGQLLRVYIDGVPLDLAAKLLPVRSRLRLSLLMHIHLHARSQEKHAGQPVKAAARPVSRQSFLGLIDNLEMGIRKLSWDHPATAWANYYEDDSYTPQAFQHKQTVVEALIKQAAPRSVWDLGANTGVFSRLASAAGIPTVAWDVDPGAVELNYRQVVQRKETCLLPLVLDLTNPSSALGWAHEERVSFAGRGPVDLVLALALIHHLVIGNNVPLAQAARFLASLGRWLVIEFVPKHDPKAQTLLAAREDIFDDYTESGFEAAFAQYFVVERKQAVEESERVLYLMSVR
ncbi:MAG: SAM-dependent methyltransferase [Chloroflexi bacterium]|nr:SAM-dependent methyltransferase [Chloroflexota bacterium]